MRAAQVTPRGVLVSPVVNFELARLAEHQRLKIHETLTTTLSCASTRRVCL